MPLSYRMTVTHPVDIPFDARRISFDFESVPPDLAPIERLHIGVGGDPRSLLDWALELERISDALRNYKE
jgi:hypothetical protein